MLTTPFSPPPSLPVTPTDTLSSSLEISQQLQRVDVLHQQLKAEAQRAQEFLAKLRRGELEAQTQAQLQLEQRQRDREEADRRRLSDDKDATQGHSMCTCSCSHDPPPPPFSSTSADEDVAHNNRNSFTANKDLSMPPLNLPTRVDEREVRDLEKRVRGLEGRVRGFEGLPPDREMALLEVERLRRELEGLARRREGLFEGLGCDEALRLGCGDLASKAKRNEAPHLSEGAGHNLPVRVTASSGQKGGGNKSKTGGKTRGRGRKRG